MFHLRIDRIDFSIKVDVQNFVPLRDGSLRIHSLLRFFLYISARHTWDHKTFMQIKVDVNDLRENLPLAVENVENFP